MNLKKIKFIILYFFIVLFSSTSCKIKHKSIINLKALSIINDTKIIKTTKNLKKLYFHHGFIMLKGENLQIKKTGTIRFYKSKLENIKIHIFLKQGNTNTKILLYINKHRVSTINPEKRYKRFSIFLPRKYLKKGWNYIYTIAREHDRSIKENVFLKIKKIIIKSNDNFPLSPKIEYKKNRIIQKPNTTVEFYFRKNEYRNISINFFAKNFSKNSKLEIYVSSKKKKKKLLKVHKIESNKFSLELNLKRFSKSLIYRLDFTLKDKNGNSILIWEKFTAKNIVKNEALTKTKKIKTKNVFYILLDALRYDCIWKKVENRYITPNINKFGQESFVFSNFFANAPYTRASVSTLFTSLLPEVHNVINVSSQYDKKLPDIAKTFKANNFHTTLIFGSNVFPINNMGVNFDSKINVRINNPLYSTMLENKIISTLKTLKKHNKNFVYIHLLPPHMPYNPPPPFNQIFEDTNNKYHLTLYLRKIKRANKYQIVSHKFINFLERTYLNNVVYADHITGIILEELKKLNFYDSSIIIISSDHGEAFYEHEKIGHNSTNYNEMIRIPFLIKLPKDTNTKAKIIYAYRSNIDVLPTLIELLGLKPVNKKIKYQGKSFAKLFFSSSQTYDRFIYSRAASKDINYSVIWKGYKYINYEGRDELYNLKNDKEEKINLAEKFPFITGYLRQKGYIILYNNIYLNKTYKINSHEKNLSRKEINALKSLGYL